MSSGLLHNPYLIVPVVAIVSAQALKVLVLGVRDRKSIGFKSVYMSGGMPSAHSAVMVSLIVTALLVDGVNSPYFGIAAVVSIVVIYDALNVRRTVGENRRAIERLIARMPASRRRLKIYESNGHTPLEVGAGAFFGALIASLLLYDRLTSFIDLLLAPTLEFERYFYIALFALMIIVRFLVMQLFRRKGFSRLPTGHRVRRALAASFVAPALLGTLLVWMQFEGVYVFRARAWVLAVLMWVAIGLIFVYSRSIRGIKERLKSEQEYFEQEKTLRKKKRQTSKKKKRRRK